MKIEDIVHANTRYTSCNRSNISHISFKNPKQTCTLSALLNQRFQHRNALRQEPLNPIGCKIVPPVN